MAAEGGDKLVQPMTNYQLTKIIQKLAPPPVSATSGETSTNAIR
jgi:hypothetical protein